jgi:hypothetical protein
MSPWNDWYHSTAHTYGTWLRGDPRGWRARHHREHVDGDYKYPPPKGAYDALHAYSKSLMKRDPVKIDHLPICMFIVQCLVDRLQEFNIPVPSACFDGIHAHALIQCRDHNPRIVFGIAKQYATAQLKKRCTAYVEARDALLKARDVKAYDAKVHGSAVGFENLPDFALFDGITLALKEGEGIWGKGSHPEPIENARHFDKTFDYIRDHERRGAIVLIPLQVSPGNCPLAAGRAEDRAFR